MNCIEKFNEIYLQDPAGVAFCPYRACPLGAHCDHQLGVVTGLAIDRGVHIAYKPKKNGVVEIASLQFSKRAQWHIHGVPEEPQGDWADYLRGATLALSAIHPLNVGICGVIEGTLPIGGLSSSAAVILAFLSALCAVNCIEISQKELLMTALTAENDYVGVSCGKLDQSCEIYSRKDHLLVIDTSVDRNELIAAPANMKPYEIAVFFSGVERSLGTTKFNMRVDEVRSAAYALKAFSEMEYGKFAQTFCRDVPAGVFEQYKDCLPVTWRKRAEHYYSEQERVKRGVEAWRRGDIEEFGRLSTLSGESSVNNWETGSEELTSLYRIMTRVDGVYGGRFSGAGFKGSCIALIDPAFEEHIREQVGREYLSLYPQFEGKYEMFVCHSADGLK